MKNTVKITFAFILFIILNISSTKAIHREYSFTVREGIEYTHIQTDTTGILRNINILKIDYNRKDLKIQVGTATSGREETSSISSRNKGIAAINGGYFEWSGQHVGLVIQDGKIINSTYKMRPPRGAIGFTANHQIIIDRVEVVEDTLRGLSGTDWSNVTEAIGGGPILVKNGTPAVSWKEEEMGISFSTTYHPRTAVGVTKSNGLIYIVVDGRQPDTAQGIPLDELADYMIRLGCHDALNLDGGGSSTMVLWDTIVNSVSDGAKSGLPGNERPVTNALIVKEIE